jgi:hypothetical protein
MCTPIIRATTACITGLSTSGCAVCVGASGLLTAYTPSGGGSSIIIAGAGTCSSIRCAVANSALGAGSASLGGCNNSASGTYAFVGGGNCNTSFGTCSFIGGGFCNSAIGDSSFVGDGICGNACGNLSTILNGCNNCITCYCTVCGAGPVYRYCNSVYNTINNGFQNSTCGIFNTIDNGCNNKICGIGIINGDCTCHNSIINGCCNVLCKSGCSTILNGGKNVMTNGFNSTISNGYQNSIGGGSYNSISNGLNNVNNSSFSQILGGQNNSLYSGSDFSIVSGCQNINSGCYNVLFGSCLIPNSNCHQYYFGQNNTNPFGGSNYQFIFGCGITTTGVSCPMGWFNNLCVTSNFYAASKAFSIPHPDPIKNACGMHLRHSTIETPTGGDNLYRYSVTTLNCSASIELPNYYKYLNCNDQIFVTAKSHLGFGFGIINEIQTKVDITTNTDGEYNVLIIGTRKDKLAIDNWNGAEVESNEQKK